MATCKLENTGNGRGVATVAGGDLFARLAAVARQGNAEGELPDFLLPLLLKVAEHPAQFAGREALVAELLQQVAEYETYSETCCEKIGFGLADIHRTLDKLRVSY